jgi:hypothetical protein
MIGAVFSRLVLPVVAIWFAWREVGTARLAQAYCHHRLTTRAEVMLEQVSAATDECDGFRAEQLLVQIADMMSRVRHRYIEPGP